MKDSPERPSDQDEAKKRETQLAMIEILKRIILLLQIKQALEAEEMTDAATHAEAEASQFHHVDQTCDCPQSVRQDSGVGMGPNSSVGLAQMDDSQQFAQASYTAPSLEMVNNKNAHRDTFQKEFPELYDLVEKYTEFPDYAWIAFRSIAESLLSLYSVPILKDFLESTGGVSFRSAFESVLKNPSKFGISVAKGFALDVTTDLVAAVVASAAREAMPADWSKASKDMVAATVEATIIEFSAVARVAFLKDKAAAVGLFTRRIDDVYNIAKTLNDISNVEDKIYNSIASGLQIAYELKLNSDSERSIEIADELMDSMYESLDGVFGKEDRHDTKIVLSHAIDAINFMVDYKKEPPKSGFNLSMNYSLAHNSVTEMTKHAINESQIGIIRPDDPKRFYEFIMSQTILGDFGPIIF